MNAPYKSLAFALAATLACLAGCSGRDESPAVAPKPVAAVAPAVATASVAPAVAPAVVAVQAPVSPVPVAPVATGATPGVKDANAMIDAGATRAKEAAAKAGAWIAKKKAEHDAKVAARQAAAQPDGSPQVVAPVPVPAK